MTIDARAFRDEGREAFEVDGRSVHENPYAGADQAEFDEAIRRAAEVCG